MGVIDQTAESALLAVAGSDIVLMAVPVAATDATFKAIRQLVKPEVLLMDVGSTKRDVVDAARRTLRERIGSFVPAHPIAGKELAGVEHADAQLYRDRQVILTPIAQTQRELVVQAEQLWTALGCQVRIMSAEDHDAAFAAVSHLPHLLAFAYLAGVMQQKESEAFLQLAGPGFRDFTRIAASDPDVWRDILSANQAEVLKAQLEKSTLIKVTLKSAEWATYKTQWKNKQMAVYLLGWYPDYIDPDDYTAVFARTEDSVGMGINYSSKEMDALFAKEGAASDIAVRTAAFKQIQALWAKENPTIPLWQGDLYVFTQKNVGGVKIGPTLIFNYNQLTIK
jgi:prephenate dehydrogenase